MWATQGNINYCVSYSSLTKWRSKNATRKSLAATQAYAIKINYTIYRYVNKLLSKVTVCWPIKRFHCRSSVRHTAIISIKTIFNAANSQISFVTAEAAMWSSSSAAAALHDRSSSLATHLTYASFTHTRVAIRIDNAALNISDFCLFVRVATGIYRWLKEKNELTHITTADTSCRADGVSDFVLELFMLEIKVIHRRRRRRGSIRKPTKDKKKSTLMRFLLISYFPFVLYSFNRWIFYFFVNTMESGSRLRIFRQSYLLLHGILLNLFSMSLKWLWLIASLPTDWYRNSPKIE